ncbi:alpha-mannosidase [Lactiplantibacillus fabifermentans T30PCM01]|uniref:Alpha-mannosidase n=1 Tax=Lactiplantibacillus fabifermentans T30PCM01 TaxID=1400520 RepID=W6T4B1_9LACO|nr:glycoside hydrolase family 38 C-terminal domain-containing protein [Lactiplantibacillus fabifermentans]ETY72679.1 alpha-mannosidase [Lactiplantibacillus fabifermentans T30PCM01]
MKNVAVVAHTHWDFEWYFTRQDARVQFAYHMDEVLEALETNALDYYLLDGQMAIVDDYLQADPDQVPVMKKLVKAGRLFVGPWYTQIDEMVTTGEAIVRNLQQGLQFANELGGTMPIGYLPDSFGQGQDMPKIYNGFGIDKAIFWRGMPEEQSSRYFYWTSDDDSKVLVANLRNGYPVGAELMESDDYAALLHKISSDTEATNLVLPAGGDQRPVDFNLKDRIKAANASQSDYHLYESTYPEYFEKLAQEPNLPTYTGEFVDPSTSKIHRGIFSSRADLKQLYDSIERLMTYEVEPLMAIAQSHGIKTKSGLVAEIWKAVARGQAHDSSGGCNSDATNADIKHRGEVALQLGISLKAYLLRKLSSNVSGDLDLFFWNPTPVTVNRVQTVKIATRQAGFKLLDVQGQAVAFEVLDQVAVDMATLRHDTSKMTPDLYYDTTIAVPLTIAATGWTGLQIVATAEPVAKLAPSTTIENDFYQLSADAHGLNLVDKRTNTTYADFLSIEDGGDEGDTYDYSPAYQDWILHLGFTDAQISGLNGSLESRLTLSGQWALPADLAARAAKRTDQALPYTLTLTLKQGDPTIGFEVSVDNQVKDHRLRLVMDTPVKAENSYADTPFGYLKRPVIDPHLTTWKEIGYHEEPTALRPMLHFANIHDDQLSWTFLGLGPKDFQVIGDDFSQLAITLYRGVGYLGRPDLIRRPSDASGLQTKYVPTPDSQLQGPLTFKGGFCLDATYDPASLQARHHALSRGTLVYQNQTLDRFTSPIQYFQINQNAQPLTATAPLLQLTAPQLVVSALTTTPDNTGLVLRVYNPTKHAITDPGQLEFDQPVTMKLLDLNHVVKSNLTTDVTKFDLAAFRPGEIRTYGIYQLPK